MTSVKSPVRRLAAAAGLLTVVLLSCGKEITAPGSAPVNAFHRFAAFALNTEFDTPVRGPALRAALTQVAFERVRITLRREDGSIALDTVVNFPAGADSLTLSLIVPLPASSPAGGVPLSLNLGYVNAAGDTVFKGGPLPVTASPTIPGSPPTPVQVPVHYTGTGSNATSVVVSPKTVAGVAGQTATLTAQALGANGQVIAGTPIAFSSSNAAVVTVPNATTGTINFVGRGTAKVYAQLLTGPADSATVTVTLPAARIAVVSGDAQTGYAGFKLAQSIVAKVTASDGVGVGGVHVGFSTPSGGSVTAADVVTAADGTASTAWTLGALVGQQVLSVSAAGLQGSPVTVTATARAAVPTKLAVSTQPVGTIAGKTLSAVQVQAQDSAGNLVTAFTGNVTVALSGSAAGATLAGTTTVAAVAGVATFSDLSIAKAGNGYTLTFSATGLTAAVSGGFAISPDAPTKMQFVTTPAASWTAGNASAFSVEVVDAKGNRVTSYATPITVGVATGPSGFTLIGTVSVTPASGLATFADVVLQRAGTYTLVLTSGAVPSLTTTSISVAAALAATIAADSGSGQTGTAGSALAKPFVARVTDSFGNAVSGRTVTWAVASGGGALGGTSSATDTTGRARTTLTLGTVAGTNTVTATSSGLSGSPVTFTASGTAAAANQLVVTTQPTTTVIAGAPLSPAVAVTAKDAGANVVTTFTGTVTASIASGPAGATIIGTTTATAASGVASFSNLAFDKAGTYTLSFAATGLTSATSSSFSVTAGVAKNITADSGAAQSAAVGSVLPLPLVVLVTDLYGNPVAGAGVAWAVTAGGGSVDSASTATNASGRTRAKLTLGATAGTNTATATASGLTGSPVTFTATGTASAATQLIITQQPPTTVTAGAAMSPALTVTAKDALGNVSTTFTGTVTAAIGTNPASGTLAGTTSVAAVNGVATFSTLNVNNVGTGYTLIFTATGLTSATSTGFSITTAAASQTIADSGAVQSGQAGQPAPAALVVRVADAFGNPISGRSVTWTVKSGGGSLDSTATTTDANGRSRVKWLLGLTVGSQVIVAKAGLADSAIFTATASSVVYNKRWTGATSTDWATASNWSPSGVPATTDSVQIDSVANMPSLNGSRTIARLTTGIGVKLTIDTASLTVAGSLNQGPSNTTVGTGWFILTGTNGTIVGPSFPSTRVLGSYSMAGVTTFLSDLEVGTGGLLTPNGFAANIAGALSTTGTGSIAMSIGSDLFNVGTNASFGGGNSVLSAGELRIGGNFTQSGASTFKQNSGFTQLVGATAKTITFADTTANSYLWALTNSGTGAVTMNSPVRLKSLYTANTGAGALTGTGKALRAMGLQVADTTQFAADTLDAWISGTLTLPTGIGAAVRVTGNPVAAAATFRLRGDLVVAGTGNFNAGAKTVSVNNLSTIESGQLTMNAGDSIVVAGNASFGGGITAGTLNDGALVVSGNFTQSTNTQAFKGGPKHRTWLTGSGNQTIAFTHPDAGMTAGCASSCFGQLLSSKSAGLVTINSDLKADSTMRLDGMDSVVAVNRTLQARGNFSGGYRSGGTVRARFVKYAGTFARTSGGTFAVDTLVAFGASQTLPAGEVIPVIVAGTATLPATMLGAVIINDSTAVLSTSGTHTVAALYTRNGGQLLMNGANDSLTVNGTFSVVGVGSVTTNVAYNLPLHFGTLILKDSAIVSNNWINADSTHTTVFAKASGTQVLSAPNSSFNLGRTVFAGASRKEMVFPTAFAMVTKGPLMVATTSDSVVPAAATTAKINVKSTVLDSAYKLAPSQLQFSAGPSTALPRRIVAPSFLLWSSLTLQDTLLVTGSLTVSGGTLDLNGKRLRVLNGFATNSTGTLAMASAADSLVVLNRKAITFNGASTSGLLTAGTIVATGNFSQGGTDPLAFVAGPNHLVAFDSVGTRTVTFTAPSKTGSRFGRVRIMTGDSVYVASDLFAATVETGGAGTRYLRRSSAWKTVTSQGALVSGLTFDGLAWAIDSGAVVSQLDAVSFIDQDPAAAQFSVKRSGTGTNNTLPSLTGAWVFGTTPTTGTYLTAADLDSLAGGNLLAVNFSTTPSPAVHGGKIALTGGATTNWPFGLSLTMAASGTWNTAASWSPAVVPTANDDVTIAAGVTASLSADAFARHVTVATTGSINVGSANLKVSGNLNASGASLTGASGTVTFTGAGSHTVAAAALPALVVDAGNVATLAGATGITGDASIAGTLVPNGNYVYLSGLLSVTSTGALKMTNAADSVVVGTASFAGIRSDTLLTDGKLVIGSDFSQSGNALSFAPTGNHVTYLSGATLPPSLQAERTFALSDGAAAFRRAGRITAGNVVQFANPGWSASHFNTLRFRHTAAGSINFSSDVYATRAEVVTSADTTMRTVGGDIPRKFFVKGTDLSRLIFNRLAVQVDAGGTITTLNQLSFTNQDSTADQLSLTLPSGAALTLTNFYFDTPPATGRYLAATTSGTATIAMVNPNPGSNGGKVSMGTGVTLSGWPSSQAFTAVGGNWSTASSWSPAGIPSRHDNVTITGATITLPSSAEAADVTLGAAGTLSMGYNSLYVYGNWVGDTSATISSLATWAKSYHKGASKTIQGRLGHLEVNSTISLGGWVIAGGDVTVNNTGASLDVGANSLTVTGAFSTINGGTLKMGSASGNMTVSGDADFSGGSTYGLISAGRLRVAGNFTAADTKFDAYGSHVLELNGSGPQVVTWGAPVAGRINALHFTGTGAKSFATAVNVTGDITVGASVTSDITGSNYVYWSGAVMRDSSIVAVAPNGRWAVSTTVVQGTPTALPNRMSTFLKVTGSLTLADSLRISGSMDVSGSLNVNGKRLQASSFEVWGTGTVQMTNSSNLDTLLVNGLASWHGGTPNITNGATVFNGSFSQAPGSAANTNTFNPSGAHKTFFMRASLIDSTVTFTNPTTSFFNDVELRANLKLRSHATIKGTLTRGLSPLAYIVSSDTSHILTTWELVGDATYPLNFTGARLKLVDGTASSTVRNLNFSGTYSGAGVIVFEINRTTPNPLTVSNANFSSVVLSGGAVNVKNTGTATVNFVGGAGCSTSLSPGLTCP